MNYCIMFSYLEIIGFQGTYKNLLKGHGISMEWVMLTTYIWPLPYRRKQLLTFFSQHFLLF